MKSWIPTGQNGALQFPFSGSVPQKKLKQVEPSAKKEHADKSMLRAALWYFFDICFTFSAIAANISQQIRGTRIAFSGHFITSNIKVPKSL